VPGVAKAAMSPLVIGSIVEVPKSPMRIVATRRSLSTSTEVTTVSSLLVRSRGDLETPPRYLPLQSFSSASRCSSLVLSSKNRWWVPFPFPS
jgi:hypothetical protein